MFLPINLHQSSPLIVTDVPSIYAKPFKIDVYLILYECIYNQCVLSHDKKDSDAMRNNK